MNCFDEAKFQEHELEVRDYMRSRHVRLSEFAAECHVSRSTAARQLKRANSVGDTVKIIDRLAERKAESQCRSWRRHRRAPK